MIEIEGIKLYTIQEIATALKVTPQTIRAYIKKGKLNYRRVGKPMLISDNDIRAFLNSGTETAN